jgi:hypothetical protein
MTINLIKRVSFLVILLTLSLTASSQSAESTKLPIHCNGSITATNNGISFIPTFSLGRPAVIFDLSLGKRLSFDPQFRFALEGKPWSFLFWWRYKLITNDRIHFSIGAHPALSFKTLVIPTETGTQEIIKVQRYLAGELSPSFYIAKNINVGFYYLFSHCFEKDGTNFTQFLTFNANFSSINLTKQYFIRFNPQVYYLKMDKNDGFYYSASMTLARRNFPISISALINKTIQSHITASKNFVWNASLIYSFNNSYVKK